MYEPAHNIQVKVTQESNGLCSFKTKCWHIHDWQDGKLVGEFNCDSPKPEEHEINSVDGRHSAVATASLELTNFWDFIEDHYQMGYLLCPREIKVIVNNGDKALSVNVGEYMGLDPILETDLIFGKGSDRIYNMVDPTIIAYTLSEQILLQNSNIGNIWEREEATNANCQDCAIRTAYKDLAAMAFMEATGRNANYLFAKNFKDGSADRDMCNQEISHFDDWTWDAYPDDLAGIPNKIFCLWSKEIGIVEAFDVLFRAELIRFTYTTNFVDMVISLRLQMFEMEMSEAAKIALDSAAEAVGISWEYTHFCDLCKAADVGNGMCDDRCIDCDGFGPFDIKLFDGGDCNVRSS